MRETVTFDISIWAILKILGVVFVLAMLAKILDILLLFYIVLILVAALSPVVDKWSKKMNRVVAISLLYLILFAVISAVLLIVVPPLLFQMQELLNSLPNYFGDSGVGQVLNTQAQSTQSYLSSITERLPNLSGQIYTATKDVFGVFVAAFTVIVLTFYLLLEEHGVRKFISQYLPIAERDRVMGIFHEIGNKMGAWMRGQLTLGLIIGIVTAFGLTILGLPYVVALAVWAGFTELIPYIGPILGAIPAILIAFTISPLVGILTIAFYIIVQQLESNFLVPKIMQKAVGLSPVIIILAMLIGGKLAGLMGIILAIPTAVIVSVLITELPDLQRAFNTYRKKEA